MISNFTYGNRNIQGMTRHPDTGEIWSHEHGPRGGDEINILRAGTNYGWPEITYGIDYSGLPISLVTEKEGMAQPLHYWDPSIAPSGMAFYPDAADGNNSEVMFPEFKGLLLVGSLKFRRLYLVELDGNTGLPRSEHVILDGQIGRIRDVAVASHGPHAGAILLLSDEAKGGLYMIKQ